MNLNPIDFNYIDGENIYPIQDYIDEQLNNVITNEIYTSNVKLNDNKILNNVLYYVGACNLNNPTNNLILSNNYNFGEIQFKTFFKYPENSNYIGTIIDYSGKLKVYHNYNILQPTFPAGYYEVETEILQLKADGINTDLQLTGIEASIVTIDGDIITINGEIVTIYGAISQLNENIILLQNEIDFIAGELQQRTAILQGTGNVTELVNNFEQFFVRDRNLIGNTVNKFAQYGVVAAGIGAVGAIFGFLYNDRMSNMAYKIESSNFQITAGDRSNLIYKADSQNALYANQYILNTSNLNIVQGFINSNITTSQFIPSLNTNAITFNGYNISNIFLPRTGGSLYGSIAIDRSTIGIPSIGYFGGIGDRIIHYLGTPTTHPYSTGINSGSLWNSVPINSTHDWYVNGVKTMSLNNDSRLILSGSIPHLQLTATNGNNLGYATANGYFSTSALAGDIVLRATNNLILQSGENAALIINKTTNTVDVKTTLLTSNFIYKGVELNTNTSNLSKDTILGSTPNVQKKYMFQFTCATPILMPNNVTYYKYDIDLRNYTQLKYIPNPNTPYRIFKIKLWLANGYFQYLYQNNKYNVLSYEVYMSNQSQNGGGGMGNAGINVRAFGFPESTELNTITQTQIILVRSANFNYLSCLSVFNTALVNVIIEDCLF